jgi:hypothetical protein
MVVRDKILVLSSWPGVSRPSTPTVKRRWPGLRPAMTERERPLPFSALAVPAPPAGQLRVRAVPGQRAALMVGALRGQPPVPPEPLHDTRRA